MADPRTTSDVIKHAQYEVAAADLAEDALAEYIAGPSHATRRRLDQALDAIKSLNRQRLHLHLREDTEADDDAREEK